MWSKLLYTANSLLDHANQMNRERWLLVFAAVVLAGLACMRGFGSRTSY